jgi:hypothetical protein
MRSDANELADLDLQSLRGRAQSDRRNRQTELTAAKRIARLRTRAHPITDYLRGVDDVDLRSRALKPSPSRPAVCPGLALRPAA